MYRAYSWCIVERERYHEAYCAVAKQLAKYYVKRMKYIKAAELLKTLLTIALYDEEAQELLTVVESGLIPPTPYKHWF